MHVKLLASAALFSTLSLAQIKGVDQNLVFPYPVCAAIHKTDIFKLGITHQRRRSRHRSEPNLERRRQRHSIRSPRLRPRSSRKQPLHPQSNRHRNYRPSLGLLHPHLRHRRLRNRPRPRHPSRRRLQRLHQLRSRPTRWLIPPQRPLQRCANERAIRLLNQQTRLGGRRHRFYPSMGF